VSPKTPHAVHPAPINLALEARVALGALLSRSKVFERRG
jgi:hypothetical protein